MLKSSLYDQSYTFILVDGTVTVANTTVADTDASNTNKKALFKNCAPFTNCISEINNIQVGKAKDLNIVIPLHNLTA